MSSAQLSFRETSQDACKVKVNHHEDSRRHQNRSTKLTWTAATDLKLPRSLESDEEQMYSNVYNQTGWNYCTAGPSIWHSCLHIR